MPRKNKTLPSAAATSPQMRERLDEWIHAMAFVILQRQMRGRWSGLQAPSSSTSA
jgi:hypothetical protein